jgi:hypothetical protein
MLDELAAKFKAHYTAWDEFARYFAGQKNRVDLRNHVESRGEAFAGYEGGIGINDAARLTKYAPNAVAYYNFITCVLGETSYTSFEGAGQGEDAAQNKLVGVLDEMCRTNRAGLMQRLEEYCGSKLYPTEVPRPTEEFDFAVKHWVKQGGDYGSAVPLVECMDQDIEERSRKLAWDIAKTRFEYRKAYRTAFEYSLEKSGDSAQIKRRSKGGAKQGGAAGAPPGPPPE